MTMDEKLTFEQCMERLEQVICQLESGEESLDKSMTLFEEGTKLAARCAAMLDTAEQKVTRLISAETGEEVPFDGAE